MDNSPQSFDLDAFVAQFPLFARAPGGIANLRGMILQLAVQGKLVGQDPTESINSTLSQMTKCRDDLVNAKVIRKQKSLPKVSPSEELFRIPAGWKWTRLNEWGVWGAGATPKRGESSLYGGSIPWFKSGELTGGVISSSEELITEKALVSSAVKLHHKGSVLVAMYGATIGKTAILGVDATTNQAVCGCSCFLGIYNYYLLLLLKAYNSYFMEQGAGGAQPNISRDKVTYTPAPLPPLEEQKRIVIKVDELMALCDQLESQQDSQARNLLAANTSATQALIQANDDFDLHWNRIAAHFNTLYGSNLPLPAAMDKGKLKGRTVALENIVKLRELILEVLTSSESNLIKIRDLGQVMGGMTPSKRNTAYWDGKINWVSPKDMKVPVIRKSIDGISESALSETSVKLIPENSILFVVRGMILAHSFPVATNAKPVTINQDMKAIVLRDEVSPDYIRLVFQGMKRSVMSLVERSTHGTCKLPVERLMEQKIPLPSLKMQEAAVEQINELLELCDHLESLLNQQRKVTAEFSQSATRTVA